MDNIMTTNNTDIIIDDFNDNNNKDLKYIKGSRLAGFFSVAFYFFAQYVIATILFLVIIMQSSADLSAASDNDVMDVILPYAMHVSAIVLVIVLIFILLVNRKNLFKQVKKNLTNYKTYIAALILFAAYFIFVMAVQIIITLISPELAEPENQQALIDSLKAGDPLVFILVTVILAPIVEELVFRYSFVNFLDVNVKFLRWVPYVLSALTFALIHESGIFTNPSLENTLQLVTYIVPALVLSLGYMFTSRNIVTVILTHMLINILATVGMFLS